MRLLLLTGLFISLVLAPGKLSAQSTKISLNMINAPLNDVLNEIEKKSDYTFLVNQEVVDVNRKVDAVFTNSSIKDILDQLFKGQNVSFVTSAHQIIITPVKTKSGDFKPQKVTGKVTDELTGETMVGVTIQIKGTTSGTTTSIDGTYSIELQTHDAILLFSYLGYEPKEIQVKDAIVINVVMHQIATQLQSVIVTALGIKREEKALGYSVQAVQGETFQKVKTLDVGTSLTGKIAGLLVKNSTEFATAAQVLIRGEAPIIVVDGVPYGNLSLSDIPADDIENISVLKGATASALYGTRGGSGAIMVTTKKGNAIKGLSVTVNSGSLFSAGFLAIPGQQSTFGRVVNSGTNTYTDAGDGSWGAPLDGREVIQWDPISRTMKAMPYLPIGKDNFKNFLEQGYILNNNINVVQQGEFGSFRASATWVRNKGQYPNSMYDKITYSVGGDMKINKFSFSSSLAYNKQTSPNVGFSGYTSYDPMYSLLIWSTVDYDVRQYKDYWLVPNEIQNNSYKSINNNPYFERNERIHSVNKDIFNGSLSMSYDIMSWLKLSLRSGFDTYSNRQEVRISKGSFQGGGSSTVIPGGKEIWGENFNGSYNLGLSRGYSLNNDLLLTGDKTFKKFTVEGLLGGTIYYKQDEGIESRTISGLTIPGYYSLSASVGQAYTNSKIYRQQVNSLFGRVAVSWNSLVYADATVRNDWSSTLPLSTRSYLYPSVSGSFVVSELLPKYRWLSLWKVRSSWTQSKTAAGIYSINNVYSIDNSAWGSASAAYYPTTVRGTDVLPQSSSTFEVGTAVNVFKNRASLDVSFYSKRMYDGIVYAGVSSASGFYSNYLNTDEEITRRGVEITANVTPVKTDDWQWDVTVNWSKYASYYAKLDTVNMSYKLWDKVGSRYDSYDLYDYQRDPQGNIIYGTGLPLYSDYVSKFGNSDPDWVWGVNTTLRYKAFQFNVSFDGRVGGLTQTTTEMYMWRSGSHPDSDTPERMLDATVGGNNYVGAGVKVVSGAATYDTYGNITSDTRVFAPNDVAVTYQSYINAQHHGTAWGGSASPVDVYSTTFFKIREVSLTYTLPKEICARFKSKGVTVSAVGQNVFLWAKQFKYSDPDGGYENFSDPSIRYTGVNLKFTF